MTQQKSNPLKRGLVNQSYPAIQANNLTKNYGNNKGIFDVTFSVQQGEAFGFLGPNGAGKTVTMRNLMGFIRPHSGTVSILGKDCFTNRADIQADLGYLPGEIAGMNDMTGSSFLAFMTRMKRIKDTSRAQELIELFELDISRKIGKMSKGTKQKVGIVCAFMSRPDILLLDEPTSGLDPLMQNHFIDLVLSEKKRGATVFLSSHIFEEVERTCDRVAFIREGRLLSVETMDEVRQHKKKQFVLTFAQGDEQQRFLSQHSDATNLGSCLASIPVSNNVPALLAKLSNFNISDISLHEQSLEEMFLHLYDTSIEKSSHE